MKKQEFIPTKLLWMDLEMTGLDPANDVILEVAAEITDFDFKTLATYETRIRQERETVAERMRANTWWQDFPENRDDFLGRLPEGKPLDQVEHELVQLVEQHFGAEPAVLAGNSIHMDRQFVRRWLPKLEQKLHYRMLDVTSWKIVMEAKYGLKFDKQETHRARGDIKESIEELKYYLDWLNGKNKHGRSHDGS